MRSDTHTRGRDSSRAQHLVAALGLAGLLITAVLWTFMSGASAAGSSGTKTFNFTGGEQAFVVPDGVTSIDVTAVGGKGATGAGGAPGGAGATATGKVAVTPGQILFVEVGGNGGSPRLIDGGFNGGASGAAGGSGSVGPGGGSGGATDIRTVSSADPGNSVYSRLLTAGGGGGGGGFGMNGSPPFITFLPGGVGGPTGQTQDGNGSRGTDGAPAYSGASNPFGGRAGYGGGQAPYPGSDPRNGGLGQGGPGQRPTGDDPYSGGGGGGGSGFFGGGGGDGGSGFNSLPEGGGGGGGGGGGSSHFGPTVTKISLATDTTGVPLLRITYKAGNPNASGLKFGKAKLNKKKGTASLPVTVPGTGTLSIGGKGLVKKRPATARAHSALARKITQAGTYKLKVKTKGKSKRKLYSAGKLKVKAVVTFKPTSGDAVHDTKKITLKKS